MKKKVNIPVKIILYLYKLKDKCLSLEQGANFLKQVKYKSLSLESGQSLITLLFFMVIGITVVSAAALIISTDILSASNTEKGLDAYYTAESGVEDGILYVLRYHPVSTITLTVSNATVTITYDSTSQTNTITSVGLDGTTKRTVLAQATFSNGIFTVSGWKEQ